MSDTDFTVRDVFDLPKPGSPEESSPRWQTLRQWMSEDVKGLKAGALPDVAAKIADLLEVPIAEIFVSSWQKTDAVKQVLEESKKTPDSLINIELAEHSINSKHQPHIEIRAKDAAIKKIQFTLQLLFKLKGFELRIQNGAIREILTGPCQARGTLQYQGLAIAEKELAPINLPATVTLEAASRTEEKPAPDKAPEIAPGIAPGTVGKASETVAPLEPAKEIEPMKQRAAAAAVTTLPQQPAASPAEPYKLKPPVKTGKIETVQESETAQVMEELPPEVAPSEEEEEREQFVL